MTTRLSKKIRTMMLVGMLGMAGMASARGEALSNTEWQQLWHPSPVDDTASQPIQDKGTYVRGLKVFHDDIYPDQHIKKVVLTPAEKHQAVVWGLTKDEEKRYVLLMKNRSGRYWKKPDISPVEVLGLNARNPNERQKYAMLYAKQLQVRIAKELAWASAASDAKKQVNQGLPLIRKFNTAKFSPYHYQQIILQPNDQLVFVTNTKLSVRHITSTLIQQIQKNPTVTLHIYFANHPTVQVVRQWAASQNIPKLWVKQNRITLRTKIKSLHLPPHYSLPQLILIRDQAAFRVDLSRF